MTLYHDLGVAEDASADEIKSAYRRAAKEHHPDRGGDAGKFSEVNRAWLVLSDPERRSKYDRTGNADTEPENPLGFATALMHSAFEEAMGLAGNDFENNDIVELMKAIAADKAAHLKGEVRKGEEARGRINAMIERAGYNGSGPNMLERIMRDKLTDIEEQLRGVRKSLEGFEKLGEILTDYNWKVDAPDIVDLDGWPQYTGSATTWHR